MGSTFVLESKTVEISKPHNFGWVQLFVCQSKTGEIPKFPYFKGEMVQLCCRVQNCPNPGGYNRETPHGVPIFILHPGNITTQGFSLKGHGTL